MDFYLHVCREPVSWAEEGGVETEDTWEERPKRTKGRSRGGRGVGPGSLELREEASSCRVGPARREGPLITSSGPTSFQLHPSFHGGSGKDTDGPTLNSDGDTPWGDEGLCACHPTLEGTSHEVTGREHRFSLVSFADVPVPFRTEGRTGNPWVGSWGVSRKDRDEIVGAERGLRK